MKKIVCFMLSMILIIGLVGCGSSKKADKVATSKPSKKIVTPVVNVINKNQSTATYDQYINVGVGDSYEKAVSVLGKPNKEVQSDNNVTYVWEGDNGKTISLVVENNKVTSKSESSLTEANASVTLDQFNQLKEGMTLEQAEAILGKGSMVYEEKTSEFDRKMYAYYNTDGSSIILNFRDGTLYSMSKNNIK